MIDQTGGAADGVPLPPLAMTDPMGHCLAARAGGRLAPRPDGPARPVSPERVGVTSLNPRDRLVRLAKKQGWSALPSAGWRRVGFSWTVGGGLAPTDDGAYDSAGDDPFLLYPLDELMFGDADGSQQMPPRRGRWRLGSGADRRGR